MATLSTQSGFVDSWQRGKSVTECNLHMLETEDFTDATFLVGSEKHAIQAHRYVLASRSCVFHAMFCGRMAKEGEITIPDIEVNVFRDFLRFLYTDKVTINSQNVTGLMYSSRKYDVETLFKQSTSFLEKSLSEENLCEILEKSHGYGETDLEEKALKMLTKASSTVTQSAAFAQLCSSCFGTFLKSKHLKLKEEEVFEAALSWTKGECEREGLSPSHENMRKVLGKLVYEIRFVILSLHFLINVVGPSRILTNDERILIMDRQVNENIDVRPFRPEARKPHKEIAIDELELSSEGINYVNRFHSLGNGIHHAGQHALSFSTNRSITLLGCQLYRTDRQPGFSLDIRLYDDQSGLISHPVQDTCWTLRNTVNDIFFPHPISVMAGRVYTIVVYLPSTSTIAGNGGRASVYQGGVKFIFSKSHTFENGSSVEKGQIPALIWRF